MAKGSFCTIRGLLLTSPASSGSSFCPHGCSFGKDKMSCLHTSLFHLAFPFSYTGTDLRRQLPLAGHTLLQTQFTRRPDHFLCPRAARNNMFKCFEQQHPGLLFLIQWSDRELHPCVRLQGAEGTGRRVGEMVLFSPLKRPQSFHLRQDTDLPVNRGEARKDSLFPLRRDKRSVFFSPRRRNERPATPRLKQ